MSTWDTIPDTLKDANGAWVGDYWGAVAFGLNTDVVANVPATWQDLPKPEYKGKVAMNGDPRTSGSAFAGVFAASLANGGSLDDITPGIDYFAHLRDIGNFIPVDATPATVAKGETPITIDWDYLQLSYSKEFAGQITWQVAVPTDGVFGNNYCQAINADRAAPVRGAPVAGVPLLGRRSAALAGGVLAPGPVRRPVGSRRDPAGSPRHAASGRAVRERQFPNADQTAAATAIIADQWAQKVSGV